MLAVIISTFMLLLSGCAGYKQLRPRAKVVDLQSYSLVLLRIVTYNGIRPEQEPRLTQMELFNLHTRKKIFVTFPEHKGDTDMYSYRHYWVGLYLPPGEYMITRFRGISPVFLTSLSSEFQITCHNTFVLPPNSVSYAGLLQLTNGSRNASSMAATGIVGVESLAGALISGYLSGSFSVDALDNRAEDIPGFKLRFPILQQHEIVYNISKWLAMLHIHFPGMNWQSIANSMAIILGMSCHCYANGSRKQGIKHETQVKDTAGNC